MSDQTGNPYGEPTAPYGQQSGAPSPYGQPPAQPSPYDQSQPSSYGQQPSGQEPYGQPAYAQPTYGQGYAPPTSDRRPGTVTAAGVVTIVFSGLSLLLFLFALVAVFVARDMMAAELGSQAGFEGITIDQVVGVVGVLFGVLAVWSLAAIVLAVFAMRRSNGARLTLVVSAAAVAVFCGLGLFGAADPVSATIVLVMVAVPVLTIVLLFTGGAGAWYAARRSGNGWQGSPVA